MFLYSWHAKTRPREVGFWHDYFALLLRTEGSIFVFLTITELQIGQNGLSSKEKFSLIQQEQVSSLQTHTEVVSS
jgi:hypothetical protein